ncbi:MAG: PAS domain S-box protein [Longimonas sp.]|uniref:PAS domain-containing sensor histidine kinase n=1 Tax=Longimonas sp. TaxID=2039626 RepID=UPI003974751C
MPATSSPTLIPPDLTLDVLWRHAAVAPLDDEALMRIARIATELCGGAYVRISLKQRDTLVPVARAGPPPTVPVAPPHRLRAVHEVLDGSQAWNCLQVSAGTFLDTNADDAIAPAEPWTHTVVPLCAPASEAPQGVIEALRPAQQDTQVARPAHECLGDCASLVATELAHRYETLRHAQTEDHLKQVAENVGSGLYRSTPEEGIIYANRAFIDLFGYDTLDEIVALPASDLYADPHDQTRLLQAEHENDGLNEFLVEMQRRDGSTFMARISSTVKRDDNGRILYYDGVVADVTERQTIERALRRQEELFRILAENAQPAVFVLDEDGTFLLAEGHDLPAIGLDPDEAVGSSVFDHYADFPAVLRGLKRALAGHEVRDTLHISTFVFDVWYSPLRNEAHEVVGCVGMAADVTEHRAAEEARLRSAERWERLVEAHPDPIVVSIGGCIQYINPAGAQVLGVDHVDQLLGEDLFAFIVDDEKRQAAMQRLQRVYEGTSSTLPIEQTIQWEDRPPRTVEVRSVPITYNGQPAAQTIVRDITRRREAERTLRAERDLLERIFNTSAAAIVVMDANGVIAEANERAEDVLRMPKAALKAGARSAFPWRIEHPSGEALPEDEKPFSRVKAAKTSMHDLQYALQWPDGTRKVVSVNGAPLLNENNVFSGAVFTLIDITDRMEAEQELRAAKREAEAAARLKTAMLANMSHEVRTPLTSIIGFSEILTEEISGRPARFSELIMGSARRLLTTLDSVLRLSKLEAGTEVLETESVDLHTLVQNIVYEKKQQASAKNLDLQLTCYAPVVCARGGRGAIQRVVYNLVSNAIKFTKAEGMVQVHLAQGRRAVLFEVTDTGVGMTQSFQERMFKAFTQESEGLAREHEGSGLGLAIVRELVDLMDGAIEVESTRGQGTRVSVFFPCA